MRTFPLLLALALGAPLLAGCASPGGPPADAPPVMASFYPLGYMAERVSGGHLSVGVIIPPGVEPHDHDLKPSDQAGLAHARLIVMQGVGLEAFHDKVVENARGANVTVVTASEGIALRGGADPAEPGQDPHTWVSPVTAMDMARNVERGFERADPANATAYRANLDALLADLRGVDEAYAKGLAHCAKPRIITTHAAFGYLAAQYNFTQFAISGFDPDAEPSAQKVRETAETARRENVTTIFFETLVSPRVAQVIAEEIHGKTAVLDPIEGVTPEGKAAGDTYLTIMLKNLGSLRDAMECA